MHSQLVPFPRCSEFIMKMQEKNTHNNNNDNNSKRITQHLAQIKAHSHTCYVVDTLEMCIHKESDKINKLLLATQHTVHNQMLGHILARIKRVISAEAARLHAFDVPAKKSDFSSL